MEVVPARQLPRPYQAVVAETLSGMGILGIMLSQHRGFAFTASSSVTQLILLQALSNQAAYQPQLKAGRDRLALLLAIRRG
jgi:hypothetical protein